MSAERDPADDLEVPEADAYEQKLPPPGVDEPPPVVRPRQRRGGGEVPEADAYEQSLVVDVGDDEDWRA